MIEVFIGGVLIGYFCTDAIRDYRAKRAIRKFSKELKKAIEENLKVMREASEWK